MLDGEVTRLIFLPQPFIERDNLEWQLGSVVVGPDIAEVVGAGAAIADEAFGSEGLELPIRALHCCAE